MSTFYFFDKGTKFFFKAFVLSWTDETCNPFFCSVRRQKVGQKKRHISSARKLPKCEVASERKISIS